MREIVPATAEMLAAVVKEPVPKTVRAIAVVDGEDVLGVTGFYPQHGALVLFSSIAPQARSQIKRHRRALVLAARRVMEMAAARGLPVFAVADRAYEGADSLLSHLGFVPVNKDVYQWTR